MTDLDRHRLQEARRLCRQIVAWFNSKLLIVDERDRRLDLYHDIWMLYLAREVKAITTYQTLLEQLRLSPRPGYVQQKLKVVFEHHRAFHGHLISLEGWEPDRFGWTETTRFMVSLRHTPASVDLGWCHLRRGCVSK